MTRALVLLAALLLLAAGQPAAAQRLSPGAMLDYLVQSVCLDAAGRIAPLTPADDGCTRKRPQTGADMAAYRKHDWPGRGDERLGAGYQASDSVVEQRGGRPIVVQTFDFGDSPRVFGRYDTGRDHDGGQALIIHDGWASGAMTEDAGAGVQWFVGPGCRQGGDARYLSWLVFADDAAPGAWKDTVAQLNLAHTPSECPTRFNAAYTRYRADRIEVPFRLGPDLGGPRVVTRPVDVIVSEHYGGDNLPGAEHLERFWFGRGFGMLRWERWENPRVSKLPDLQQRGDQFAATGRCRPLAWSEPPQPGWRLLDCRTWTNLARPAPGWSVDAFGWQALAGFDRR